MNAKSVGAKLANTSDRYIEPALGRIEAHLEQLAEVVERCGKIIVISKTAIACSIGRESSPQPASTSHICPKAAG
jgi:hypothetical protein